MNPTPDKIIKQLVEYVKQLSPRKRLIALGSAAGVVIIIVAIALLINKTSYTVLYRGLSSDEAGKIIMRLNEMEVSAKLDNGGTILVPKKQEAQLKMTLAGEGYPQSTLNYDIFSSNSSYMTTDFEKKKYLLFQLQNRLQDAIKTIDGVHNAIVTISLPSDDSFVLKEDQNPATASVVLELTGTIELSSSQIRGIEELVAKSVPGLEAKNVAIVDGRGGILNEKYSIDSLGNSYTKLDLEKNIGLVLESKIYRLFSPVYDTSAIRVAVSATVDINKKISEQTTYTPVIENSGVIAQQELFLESAGGGAAAGGVPGSGSNTGVAVYPQAGSGEQDGISSSSSNTDYLVNQLKEQVQRDGYEIKDISAAVFINSNSLSQEQIRTFKEMVSAASGINIEKITIASAQFIAPSPIDSPEGILFNLSRTQLLIAAGGGLLLLIIIAVVMIILLKRKKRRRQESRDSFDKVFGAKGPVVEIPGEIILNETREQGLKRQIQEFSSSSPDIVAQLLRTWIKEGEEDYE